MIYVHYNDSTGEIIGFHDDRLGAAPAPALPLTAAEHADILGNPGLRRIVDGAIVAVEPEAPSPGDLKAELARLRMVRENAGTVVAGALVDTSERNRALMDQAARHASFPLNFKGADGAFVTIDAATLNALISAVAAHVQASFDAEKTVFDAIEAGTVTTWAELTAAWEATA